MQLLAGMVPHPSSTSNMLHEEAEQTTLKASEVVSRTYTVQATDEAATIQDFSDKSNRQKRSMSRGEQRKMMPNNATEEVVTGVSNADSTAAMLHIPQKFFSGQVCDTNHHHPSVTSSTKS
jgi:hypothetical protein